MDQERKTEQLHIRWRYLGLAALIFCLAAALLGILFHVPDVLPDAAQAEPTATGSPPAAATPPARPTAEIRAPAISRLEAVTDDGAGTVTFYMKAQVPPQRQIDDVVLWYGSDAAYGVRRMGGPFSSRTAITLRLDLARAGLTGIPTSTQTLDYWWLVRDTAGESARVGGSVSLGPALQALLAPAQPADNQPEAVDSKWIISTTQHFRFHYLPASAAERDRFKIGGLAERALDQIRSRLDMEFEGQMSIYLVPRVFWQGGAAYGDKVQLISYLDRNYTGVETWSYFTHEGTHALAQDLLQPKENGGGPDGVLVEGLAVWVSDGHYRQEPLDAWAAVVAASDSYLPLAELREGPFYDYQHETSYLEAASFVKYLVENYGLEKLKALYGLATGEDAHDQELVFRLYNQRYDQLEAGWLEYMAGLEPTAQEAETWQLKVRSFDLMRRYETELDPDARILPSSPPPKWTSDTIKAFTSRPCEPANVVLETALIAVQERLYGGDMDGARLLLDDVEAALDAGGAPVAPSLQARREIVDLIAAQDRAVLLADPAAYTETLSPGSGLARETEVREALRLPYVAYRQEIVRLDLSADGDHAEGVVLLHADLAAGASSVRAPADGQLFRVILARTPDGWHLVDRESVEVTLALPAPSAD